MAQDIRIRDVSDETVQKWERYKARVGAGMTHREAFEHFLEVFEEEPELVTGESSQVEFR